MATPTPGGERGAAPAKNLRPESCTRVAALLFVLLFAFYAATLAPGLMPGDSGDLVQAAATLQEAHPPGYPLYSLLGKLFVALPVGSIPYRLNLMSAFFGGLAGAFLFLALVLLTRSRAAALAGTLLFAFNPLFWFYFVVAEVFCLNNFFLALVTFLALRWRERHVALARGPAPPTPPTVGGDRGGRRLLLLTAFLCGISLGNHHTMVLVFPGLLAFAAATDRTVLSIRRIGALAGWFALGVVLPYLYLPAAALFFRDHRWENTGTLSGVVRLFFRVAYGTLQLGPVAEYPTSPSAQAAHYFGALATQYLWPGFLLGPGGLVVVARRDRPFLLYTGAGFLLGVAFLLHANIDPSHTGATASIVERFYQLPNFFFLLWIAAALGEIARRIRPVPGAALLLLLPAALLVSSHPKASQRGNRLYPRFLENILGTLPANAVFLCGTDEVALGAGYVLEVERRRPDVAFVLQGLAGRPPYDATLRRRYPDLVWPASKPGGVFDLEEFARRNMARRRLFTDDLPHGLGLPAARYGLVYEIRREPPSSEEAIRTNEELFRRYDHRQVNTALYPPDSMCFSIVVFHYLFQRFRLAEECNRAGRFADALRHLEACRQMDGRGVVARSPDWQREVAKAEAGLRRAP